MIRSHVIVVETIHSQRISNIYTLLVKIGLSGTVYIINWITTLRITLKCIGGADHVECFSLLKASQSRPSDLPFSHQY